MAKLSTLAYFGVLWYPKETLLGVLNMILRRDLQDRVENSLFKGKVVIIYGARQVGKTTLVKEIQKKHIRLAPQ